MADNKESMQFTPQQTHRNGGGDRRNKQGASHYTDAHWHISKAISISTVMAFVVLLGGGLTAYSSTVAEFATIRQTLETTKNDLIRKETVLDMFKLKDVEIAHLAEKIDTLSKEIEKTNSKIDQSNHILQQILVAMPKQVKL